MQRSFQVQYKHYCGGPSFVPVLKGGCVFEKPNATTTVVQSTVAHFQRSVSDAGVPQCLDLSPLLFMLTLSQIWLHMRSCLNPFTNLQNCHLLTVACLKRMCGFKLRDLSVLRTTMYINESPSAVFKASLRQACVVTIATLHAPAPPMHYAAVYKKENN